MFLSFSKHSSSNWYVSNSNQLSSSASRLLSGGYSQSINLPANNRFNYSVFNICHLHTSKQPQPSFTFTTFAKGSWKNAIGNQNAHVNQNEAKNCVYEFEQHLSILWIRVLLYALNLYVFYAGVDATTCWFWFWQLRHWKNKKQDTWSITDHERRRSQSGNSGLTCAITKWAESMMGCTA